jgi:Putative stress-responsive transcriptional regulator
MKKLYKLREGKKIAGVCAGVAEYFDLDVSLIRILWAASAICAGTGIVLYIVAAAILPYKDEIKA